MWQNSSLFKIYCMTSVPVCSFCLQAWNEWWNADSMRRVCTVVGWFVQSLTWNQGDRWIFIFNIKVRLCLFHICELYSTGFCLFTSKETLKLRVAFRRHVYEIKYKFKKLEVWSSAISTNYKHDNYSSDKTTIITAFFRCRNGRQLQTSQ
jgi:hypothetical protein